MSSPACVLEPTAPVPVDPYLFGLNTLLGQIDNLPFEDPALLRAARTLGAGAFRWPGGGLADSWSLVDGRYDDHAKSAWANIWAPRTAWAPRGTFGPRRFWDGVGSASAGAARTGPVWVLNVFSLSPAEQLQQVAFLRQTGVPVRRVEIGNGPWNLHDPEYQTRWPNASAYMASILPVCKRVRELFPAALISVAGRHADQRWNAGLAEYADHFDAVSLRVYSPIQCDLDLLGPGLNQYSAVAAWGEHANIQTRKQLQSVLDKPIWLSEIELGDHHGCARTPFAHLRKDGAIPGIFWAGHVLAAINSYDASTPLRALNYHLFSHQRACRAGARHDTACWGVNESLVHLPPRERSKTSPVHVNGAGQILAHVNAVALRAHPGQQMRRVRRPLNLSCGSLNFGCVGEKRRCTPSDNPGRRIYSGFPLGQGAGSARCLQAAVFDSTTKPNASFVVLNRCTHSIEATLGAAEMLRGRLPRASRRWRLVATTYLADDPGALVGLPDDLHEDPFVFPWRTGPLSPAVNATELHHDDLDRHTVVLQAVSLTIATFSPAGEAPFQVPVDLRPGGRWAWRRDLARGTASWAAPDQRAFGKRLPKERAWRDGARAQDAHLASDTMPAGQRRSALRMPKNTSALRWQHAAPRPAPVVPKERPARATRATCDTWFSAHGVRDLASCRLACCEDAAPIVTPSHWGAMSHSERMAAFCCDARAEAPPWPPTNASQPGERLNVVHMVAHDLRADLATPTLTSLDGTVQFRHAFAQAPICSPSRFSFFVGRRAAVTRYHGFNADEQQRVMPLPRGILARPTDVTPIAKAFADGGYATYGAATSWAERRDAWLGCVSCWTHGYWEGPSSSCTTRETPKRASESECWSQWGNDRAVAGHVATWLEDYAASPSAATARGFYVLAGFYAGHSAWPDEAAAHHAYGVGGYKLRNADVLQSRPKGTGELTAARAYGEGMRTASKLQGLRRGYLVKQKLWDESLAKIVAALRRIGLWGSTALVFHADHGLSLGEFGTLNKAKMLDVDTRVPLWWRLPWRSGRTVLDEVVELVDVFPTLCELASLTCAPTVHDTTSAYNDAADDNVARRGLLREPPLDGRSLMPLLRGEAAEDEAAPRYAISHIARCPSVTPRGYNVVAQRYASWPLWCINWPRPANSNGHDLADRNDTCRAAATDATRCETLLDLAVAVGVSVRSASHRYVVWAAWDAAAGLPRLEPTAEAHAARGEIELYEYSGDEYRSSRKDLGVERVNLAGQGSLAAAPALVREACWALHAEALKAQRVPSLALCSAARAEGWKEVASCAALGADEAACWRSYERRGRRSLWSRTLRACAVSPANGACEAGHAHVCAMLDNTALLYIFVGTSAALVLLVLVAKALRES